MRKNLSICLLCIAIITCSFLPFNNKIESVKYYLIERGKSRYNGVNEYSIKNISTATIGTISDQECLINIESKLDKIKQAKSLSAIGAIYLLCEIHYANGITKTLSFEDAKNGYSKFGNKIYFYSTLDSQIIGCINNKD